MSKTTSEADIIFNRTNVALAKSQRLIASWLPPRTEEELRNAKPAEEIEKEEAGIFVPMPDLLGLGAKVPEDGEVKRQELSSNDKLRRQLLGKDMARLYGKSGSGGKFGSGSMPLGSKPRPTPMRKAAEDEDDDEEGRSSLGKSKRRKHVESQEPAVHNNQIIAKEVAESSVSDAAGRSKQTRINYLDEVLAEQQRKKQKKKRKREKEA